MRIVAPHRVRRSHVQHFTYPKDIIFPLLCPVKEVAWAEGWDPEIIITASGFAEEGCAFVTGKGRDRSYWVITTLDPSSGILRMVRITPDVAVCQVDIEVEAVAAGKTDVSIAYTLTSLGPGGDAHVTAFTEARYLEFMELWERELSAYLHSSPPPGS